MSDQSDIRVRCEDFEIRVAKAVDIAAVSGLDAAITGIAKPEYWNDMFARYGMREKRYFLVTENTDGDIIGFIIGEVRAWEFGSPPSGWIFALGVDPNARLNKVGSRMFDTICDCLARDGVGKVRTMLAREDELNMTFFRSQGMMGGPFIELEMPLPGHPSGERTER